ncbi:ammonia-forming cytochrome c nitrite reductase subunit c552 [Verrucomicrobiaceae bacterium N1E253]|uniref:Ammonia-forming cytochrome c nitrite reductase subunit c552 n=1 Tax=Oceaniferula marina TaxID=2748318 RepID=A0A851GF59_9BACT|nr:tetratricopeptide repeat protein [Oceaniferula marina]NWK55829.1 ammonia-forming cytochrome c nitrite reductase subunit c552 [Oceaniferula marina]
MFRSFTHYGLPAAIALCTLTLCSCGKKESGSDASPPEDTKAATSQHRPIHPKEHDALFASIHSLPDQNAISQKCQGCHEEIHAKWQQSDHGQANRHVDLKLDGEAFSDKSFKDATAEWKFTNKEGKLTMHTDGKDYTPGMIIGITPLIQYLTADSGGRWQTPTAGWDPHNKEWFDVISGDDRTSADWGHWTGRGMTWNTQCAWCHMTDFRKNYDNKTDTYDSHWTEMGVGCTQCHGHLMEKPNPDNGCLIDIKRDRDIAKNHPDLVFDNCATCHSRRGEFNDTFHIGAKYGDHYQLQLPSTPRLYYPDGQIKDEDYVWASLRMSNMGHKGVRCIDCHDVHSTRLKYPLENNTLCMSCHAAGTNGRLDGAMVIDPVAHSKHFGVGKHNDVGSGHACVDCHMTETTYMGRDPRRDHGFHVPDPQLTKENGTPNACNKCHTDQDVDWSIKWVNDWYGEKMHTPERKRQRARTRALAAAFEGQANAIDPMLKAYANEENPMWLATLLEAMRPWATDARVQRLGREGVHNKDSMVRAAACHIMEFSLGNDPWLEPMLKDPVKEVRMAAAWAMRTRLSQRSEVLKELRESLFFGADQPIGAMRLAELASQGEKLEEAKEWMEKAIALDQTSAAGREAYAILLGQLGKPKEALEQLGLALKLDPNNGRYLYLMALTYAELKQTDKTEELLKQTVAADPNHDRAHYNLGLLYAGQDKLDEAIASIRKAERIHPQSPDYPYARATIHMRKGEKMEAFEACRTVLGIDRNYRPALQLLQQIGNPQAK